MRTNWIARLARSRLASSPRSFDMLGGASSLSSSSSVVVRSFVGCFFVLASSSVVLSVSRAVAVSLCLACLGACLSCGRFLSVPPSCLLAIRSALSSYRSAPRSFDMRGGADTVCVSVWSRLGRCCLLLAVAVLRAWSGGFRRPRCLPCGLSIGSALFSRVVPSFLLACPRRRSLSAARGVLAIACGLVLRRPRCLLRPVVVVGSSWADRRRVSSSSVLALWLVPSARLVVRSIAPSCLSDGRGDISSLVGFSRFSVSR